MPRLTLLAFFAASSVFRAEDLESCTEALGSDESSLLQFGVGVTGKKQQSLSFAAFVQLHSREYAEGSAEFERRRSVYEGRAREIAMLNARPARLWTAGVNHLSDWTDGELSRLRGWKGTIGRRSGAHEASVAGHGSGASLLQTTRDSVLKDEVSWSHLNASKVVRDQGGCGSCWAFASALMLEANHEIHQKQGRTFSPQEFVDCVPNIHHCGGAGGCNGATVELAMEYAVKHGLEDETASPYVGHDNPCSKDLSPVGGGGTILARTSSWFSHLLKHKVDASDVSMEFDVLENAPGLHSAPGTSRGTSAFGLTGWERLPENKYEPLMRAVAEHGPVAVSVAATSWSSYIHGIFDGCDKDAVIDHAVTLIGYGKDDGLNEKFWLIQNSWGNAWGEQGRIRILRRDSDETHCGTDRQPKAGTACDNAPEQVTVCGMCGILYDSVVAHFSKAD